MAGVAAISLGGCATIDTARLDYAKDLSSGAGLAEGSKPASRQPRGLTYFLPRQLVRMSFVTSNKDLDQIVGALAAARVALGDAKAALAGANERLALVTAQRDALPNDAPERATMTVDVAKAAGAAVLAKAAVTEAKAEAEGQAALAIAAARDAKPLHVTGLKLELLAPSADPRQRYVLDARHNPLRDDTHHFAISSDGLLSSTNIVAVDRTADILVELAGSIAAVGVGPRLGTASATPVLGCPVDLSQGALVFDPMDSHDRVLANQMLSCVGYALNVRGFENAVGDPLASGGIQPAALFYRTATPVQIDISEMSSKVPRESLSFTLPQAGPISYLPMSAGAFVRTTSDVQFSNGMVVDWKSEQPSEVLEAVRTPFRIVERLIAVPAQLVSLKVDYSSKDAALAQGKRDALAARAALEAAQRCVSLAQAEARDPAPCFAG